MEICNPFTTTDLLYDFGFIDTTSGGVRWELGGTIQCHWNQGVSENETVKKINETFFSFHFHLF